jgi:Zn-dependent peptidase ImmA (M78 family)/transcriptional regulator with XRE-family HTH domain
MPHVNHRMIQLARESRGLSQTDLSKKTKIPQPRLSRIEGGNMQDVEAEVLKAIATELNYPESFFNQDCNIYPPNIHYRKRETIDQKSLLRADALMNIYRFNLQELLKVVDVSNQNVPRIKDQYESPEQVAQSLRAYWRVPTGPIEKLSGLLEGQGIIIVPIEFGTDKIEGRSVVADTGHAIIFVNKNSSGDRQRLTIVHELGHIVMHINSIPTFGRDEEKEAFDFAIEFLMPYHEVKHQLKGRITLEKLAQLKTVWKVSMQAILKRLQSLNIVEYNQARYLWSQFNAQGIRKKEPVYVAPENPVLVNQMIDLYLQANEYAKTDLVDVFRIPYPEIEERYFEKPQNPFLRISKSF